jgi:hypothetical protein
MDSLSQKNLAGVTWRRSALAGTIGVVSLAALLLTVPRVSFEYVLLPLFKDRYILPERRFWIFDAVTVVWCIDGLIAAFLLFRSTAARPNLRRWARRAVLFYFLGLAVLIADVLLGTWLCSHCT